MLVEWMRPFCRVLSPRSVRGGWALGCAFGLAGLWLAPGADGAAPARADIARVVAPLGDRYAQLAGIQEYTGRLIVKPWRANELVARGATADEAAATEARAGARLQDRITQRVAATGEWLVSVPDGRLDGEFAQELEGTGDYQYAQPDWMCFPATAPNDPGLAAQHHHRSMRSAWAWEFFTGSPAITCAVVDTGVTLNHPDLVGRLVEGYNVPDQRSQSAGGDVSDVSGHGTAVAGCVAATGNNGAGVCGMGWGLRLMPVRASNLPSGGASISAITAGARWAADNGARVVSVSYTGIQNAAVQTTGAYIRGTGGLLCWAADNSGRNWSTFDWPDVIVVGASEPDDTRCDFSSFGFAIDCVAPGRSILTCAAPGAVGGGDGYAPVTGTSFSTPIAAGALAMIWSARPTLPAAEVLDALLLGCDDVGDPGDDAIFGAGRINLHRALSIVLNGAAAPIPAPDEYQAVQGRAMRLDVLANDSDPLGGAVVIDTFGAASAGGGSVGRSVGTGPGGRDELVFTPAAGPAGIGADTITYAISNGGLGAPAATTVRVSVIDPADLQPAVTVQAPGPGLKARYYDLDEPLLIPSFQGLASFFTGTWDRVDFAPSDGDFADSLRMDNVGATAEGYLSVPADGVYALTLEVDDGGRLLLDGREIVRAEGRSGSRRVTGLAGLRGGAHRLRIEYFEAQLGSGLRGLISGPNLPEQVLGGNLLFQEQPLALDVNFDGLVDPDDLSDFVTLYFAGNQQADFDGDGQLTPDDLSDYIAGFFTP